VPSLLPKNGGKKACHANDKISKNSFFSVKALFSTFTVKKLVVGTCSQNLYSKGAGLVESQVSPYES
jgi:hypothetical protein